MTVAETQFSQLFKVAQRAAIDVAQAYPGYVELDDMRQEALAWLYDPKHASRVGTDENGDVYATRLHAELLRYLIPRARAERTHRSGGNPADDSRYGLSVLRLLLPAVWTGEGAMRSESEIRGSGDPSEGGTWQVAVIDVSRALNVTVGKADQAILFRRYALGQAWDEIAASVADQPAPDAVRMRANRALTSMLDHLNGVPVHPTWGGPGSRRARSNKVMQHLTDNVYSGGAGN